MIYKGQCFMHYLYQNPRSFGEKEVNTVDYKLAFITLQSNYKGNYWLSK